MRHRLALTVVSAALVSGHAFAGVVVTSTHTVLETKKVDSVMAYFEADRMKIVMPDTTVIYRGDLNKFWVISAAKHNYMEMTAETMKTMGGQMEAARAQMSAAQAQMQAQLSKLPPEQRAMIEKQLAQQGIGPPGAPPSAKPVTSYVKAGPAKTVPSGRCDLYSRMQGPTREADLCIAPIAAVGLTPADFRVFDSFQAFVAPVVSSPMTPKNEFMNWQDMNKAIGFQGIPLETTTLSGGKPSMQDTVQKIEHSAIPTATFELPQGLTKQEMPQIPGGGR
jgi:hypothetical protein